MRPLLAASNAEVMAESSSTLILPSQAGTPKAEHQSFFHVQISGPKQPLGDVFVRIYEHLDQLREGVTTKRPMRWIRVYRSQALSRLQAMTDGNPSIRFGPPKNSAKFSIMPLRPRRKAHYGFANLYAN